MYPDAIQSRRSSLSYSNSSNVFHVHFNIELYDSIELTEEQLKSIQDNYQTIVQIMKEATNR